MAIVKILKHSLLLFVFVFLSACSFYAIDFLIAGAGGFFSTKAAASVSDGFESEIVKIENTENPIIKQKEEFSINAESFISIKAENGQYNILLSKNEQDKLPVASLTKLMTALVVLDNYDLNQKVTVSKLAMAQEGEQGNLKEGEVLSVKNLLYISLIESSNRASFALSEVVGADEFIILMNNKEFDLYINGRLHHKLVNTNKFLGEVPGVVGGKTGWTIFSKGCFMVVQEIPGTGNYLLHIILGADDRFLEMQKLIDWVRAHY